jgi:hypothetical protein
MHFLSLDYLIGAITFIGAEVTKVDICTLTMDSGVKTQVEQQIFTT